MPKIDVTQVLKSFGDTPLLDRPGYICEECEYKGAAEFFTLRMACIVALTEARSPGKDGRVPLVEGKEQLECFDLALRIKHEDKPDISSKEIANIQELIAARYPPVITGQAWKLLEGKVAFAIE